MINLIKGKQKQGLRLVIYGDSGVGKTTFASQFPSPCFIDLEEGSFNLDTTRTPTPSTWAEFNSFVDYLAKSEEIKTVIIDSLDLVENLASQNLQNTSGVDSIEKVGGGYSKGYTMLAENIGELLNKLTQIAKQGKHIIIISHATTEKIEEPNSTNAYDRWSLNLTKKTRNKVIEWADIIGFIYLDKDEWQAKTQGGFSSKKTIAKLTGERLITYENQATLLAKTRYELPKVNPLTIEHLEEILTAEQPKVSKTKGAKEKLKEVITLNGITLTKFVEYMKPKLGLATFEEYSEKVAEQILKQLDDNAIAKIKGANNG